MTNSSSTNTMDHLAEQAVSRAEDAIAATRESTNRAFDTLNDALHHAGQATASGGLPAAVGRAIDQGQSLARQGLAQVRDAGLDVQAQAHRASDRTLGWIRHDPVKAVLIAAATGAVMAGVVAMLVRPSGRGE